MLDLDAVRSRLDPDPRPVPAPGDRLAAVLALVIDGPEPEILLTERSPELSRHAGEISFPGGLMEPDDDDLRATALRETHEEIGLDPTLPWVLGGLPPVHTTVSGILVTPFLATVAALPALSVNDEEIVRVLTVPIARLAGVEEERSYPRPEGGEWRGWVYVVDDATIWGATGWMLHEMLTLVREEVPWLTTGS